MKTLLLMRHAKSSWDDPQLSDHDRPLNRRGLRDAPRMGRWLVSRQSIPDSVTCSSAVRTTETAQHVAGACGIDVPIRQLPSLYLADPDTWMAAIHSLPESSLRALCIGHNPGLEEVLRMVTGTHQSMPTGAIAALDFSIEGWSEFDFSKALHGWTLWRPKSIDDGEETDDD